MGEQKLSERWRHFIVVGEGDSTELLKDTEIFESRAASTQSLLNAIRNVLSHRFGMEWINERFQASDYDSCDSVNTSDEVAKLIREWVLRWRLLNYGV